MADDKFADYPDTPVLPASSAQAVVPNDGADLEWVCNALHAATPGTVRVTTRSGDIVNIFVAEGGVVPIRVRRVWQSGTSATGIVALY